MKTKLTALALFLATAATIAFYPSPQASVIQQASSTRQRPQVEAVFVLDTTGSMGGLIAAAKEKIWSIATTMAQADPAPDIKIGLVAYRDRGDTYVTRVIDLTQDLDSLYASLMEFAAEGGGDGPESVNQALDAAINQLSWSQSTQSYKVVFLVGDAPPHMDYQDETQYPKLLELAATRGIIVNTVQCGESPQTAAVWQSIARLGHGRYFQVAQAGSAVAVATPFDADIAKLSAALDDTRIYYGTDAEKAAAQRKLAATAKLHETMSVESSARRAAFNASASGAGNLFGENELVDAVAQGRVALADIPEAELPAPVRALPAAEQEKLIAETAQKRSELKRQIETLATERDRYIATKVEAEGGAADSLDSQIYDVLREQAAPVGLSYEEGPKF